MRSVTIPQLLSLPMAAAVLLSCNAASIAAPQITTLLAGVTALAQGNVPLFDAPWRAFGTGDFPTFKPDFFDVGDIDGDGDLDVVASLTMFSGPGLSVLLSNGDGTFAEEVIYPLNPNQTEDMGEVVLADFDMDGDLDAIGTIPGNAGLGAKIAVWRNNGDGTYALPSRFATGPGPIGLVVGDFTGDGFPDVVTADLGFISGTNDTISLLRHNGQTGNLAGFLSPTLTHVGDNSQRVAAADIDGDGDLDLVVGRAMFTGGSNGINVLTNDGSGNFVVGASFQSVPGVSRASPAVMLADLDNDGDFDLISAAAVAFGSGKIAIRLNNGAGSFGAPVVHNLAPNTFVPHSINVGDLNGDGRLDIIASTPSGRTEEGWNVLMSAPGGGYRPAEFFDAAKQTFDLAAFDTDGDGDLDVVTVAEDSSVITVHQNLGGGEFFVPTLWPLNALNRDMDFGDIDNDGDLDLVTTNGSIYYLRNNGDGTFAPVIHRTIPIGAGEVKLRDMNNDGFLDLLMIAHPFNPPYNFAVSLNNGNGTFAPGVVTFVNACQGGQIDAFDLDNDGDLDVVLTEPGSCAGGSGGRIFIARNNGNGTSFTLVTPLTGFGLPFRIGGADLDHDGNIDLVSRTSLGMTVFPGNGDLTFTAPLLVTGGPTGVFDFVLADLNLDGNEDLCMLVPNPTGSFGTVSVSTQLGVGDLTFGPRNTHRGPNGLEAGFRISSEIEADDVNGDGFPDIILSNNAPNDVSVFLGNGDGTLQPQDRYGMGNGATDALAGDFTGDGIVDIAAVVALPPFVLDDAVVVIAGLQGSAGGILGDINGDGVVDMIDVKVFVAVLLGTDTDPNRLAASDLNGDGGADGLDIQPFVGVFIP